MKATVVERRAELLRLYAGLPWKTALARVEAAAPGSLLIPGAGCRPAGAGSACDGRSGLAADHHAPPVGH